MLDTSSKQPMRIRIGFSIYDVTGFKHPGGSVIASHAWNEKSRIDSTNAFYAFHHGRRAHRLLQSFPHVAIDDAQMKESINEETDFDSLRLRLQDDGYFRPSKMHVAYRIILNLLLWWISSILFANGANVCAILLMSVNYAQCGWIQHECGHKSFTSHPVWDPLLQTVYLNVMMGGNRRFWNDQHFAHHANTQNIYHDKDLKTHPLVAFDRKAITRKGHTWFTRRQHRLYWWLINPIVWMVWTFVSHPMFAYKKRHLLEYAVTKATSLVLYCVYFAFACGVQGIGKSLLLFHLVSLLGTCLLLATFTVSHTTTGSYEIHKGWVVPASSHTVNIHDHWFINWWMGYLNFQIEHHLFPTMPQFRQNKVGRDYVKPFFTKHSIPYHEKTFWEANLNVYQNLRDITNMGKDFHLS